MAWTTSLLFLISGLTVMGVKTGAAEMAVTRSDGGGGRSSTGFSSNVVGAMVISSSTWAVAITGVARLQLLSG